MVLPLLGGLLGTTLAGTGAFGGILAGMSPLLASSIGSGLGSFIETGDIEKAAMTGLGGLAGGALLGGTAAGALNAGAPAAATTAGQTFAQQAGQGAAQTAAQMAPGAAASTAAGLTPQAVAGMGIKDLMSPEYMKYMMTDPGKISGLVGAVAGPAMMYDPYANSRSSSGRGKKQSDAPGRSLSSRGALPTYGMGEFDYKVSPNYGMQAGGMVGAEAPTEKMVISDAISALQGSHPAPELALAKFVQVFGEEALMQLVDSIKSGEMGDSAARSQGMVNGPATGGDIIPAQNVNSGMDILLEDGEYIMPRPAVEAIGPQNLDRMVEEAV